MIKHTALAALLAAAAVAGCGKKEEVKPAASPAPAPAIFTVYELPSMD